ncbi:hypothetical protein [Streptomyces sp. SID1121]|uniref:hypothetical protein n=1 Tax=Streptomyces sp. SID1121 TaxID=3425888 RepID=UPI0040575344
MSQRHRCRESCCRPLSFHVMIGTIASLGIAMAVDVFSQTGSLMEIFPPIAGIATVLGWVYLPEDKRDRERVGDVEPGTGVTALAARLAGRRRSYLRTEWLAHLSGDPENGVVLSSRQRRRYAFGFLVAALRLRLADVARPCWRPVDWLLGKEARTQGFIALVVGAQATYIVGRGGLIALVTEVWEPCGILGAALYVLTRWLRRVRGGELADQSPPPD